MQRMARIPNNIFALRLDGKELKVYILLSALNYAAGGYVKISEPYIAARTSLSPASVKRALAALKGKGLISCAKTYIDGARQANRYRITAQIALKRKYFLLDLSLLSKMSGEKLLVYLCLCRHANASKRAYISERAIAERTGLSRNTVRKYTAELEAERLIGKEERFYRKSKDTAAKRCFAYTVYLGHESQSPSPPPSVPDPPERTAICHASAELILSVVSLHLERILPLRVPP